MENNDIKLAEGQIVEVEYDATLVKLYQDNYIMEEEGVGSEMGEVFDQQTTFNTDTLDELLGEGAEIDDVYKND